jgi:hypothetical protein
MKPLPNLLGDAKALTYIMLLSQQGCPFVWEYTSNTTDV